MIGSLERALIGIAAGRGERRRRREADAEKYRKTPLLIEMLEPLEFELVDSYSDGLFRYGVRRGCGTCYYEVVPMIERGELALLRGALWLTIAAFSPDMVVPLTFTRLIDVLSQLAASELSSIRDLGMVRELSRLAAFEAVGLPTIFAISRDRNVSEFFLDAPGSTLYLDHARHGRCETRMYLSERERKALEVHMDTFKGYTLDFANPSLKNEFDIFGTRLRVSLDLAPLAVSGFSLDVRKLTSNVLKLRDLIAMDVLSREAAAFLIAALGLGMNVTIVGETGTGKTTLLNALDEGLDARLRRIYIEDAVESRDLLEAGYHQMKLKVDPFERGEEAHRTKSAEIIKILHRSPDMVILGEIQSEEHSRAFFQSLSAGITGLQTFHSSSPGQAMRRWEELHGISRNNLLDLSIIVLMSRPERLGSKREVRTISMVTQDDQGRPSLVPIYERESSGSLARIINWEQLQFRRPGLTRELLLERLEVELQRSDNIVRRMKQAS